MSWFDVDRGKRPYLAHPDFDDARLAHLCKKYDKLRDQWVASHVASTREIEIEETALRHEARCKTCKTEMVVMRLEGAVWQTEI
jgi:hypothetical protein